MLSDACREPVDIRAGSQAVVSFKPVQGFICRAVEKCLAIRYHAVLLQEREVKESEMDAIVNCCGFVEVVKENEKKRANTTATALKTHVILSRMTSFVNTHPPLPPPFSHPPAPPPHLLSSPPQLLSTTSSPLHHFNSPPLHHLTSTPHLLCSPLPSPPLLQSPLLDLLLCHFLSYPPTCPLLLSITISPHSHPPPALSSLTTSPPRRLLHLLLPFLTSPV